MAKYKAYPEYKDSGVEWLGEIPAHWQLKRLGTQFVERKDKVSDKKFPPLSVSKEGIVPQIETVAKTDAGDNRKLVMINDFVINSRSDRKGSAGVSKLNGSVSLISIVLQPQKIAPQYTHHLLRSSCFQEEFYRFGKGIVADLWSTNYSEMKNILIPIPPKNECNLISLFLDNELKRLHKLIAKQQNLIELLKEKRQALISHAVTKGLNPGVPMKDSGIEWATCIPSHWNVKPTFSCCDASTKKNTQDLDYNVLSLSYGKIVTRDIDSNYGLLPESFNTYQYVNKGEIILRLTDLQNDKKSLRVGLVTQKGIITSAYLKLAAKRYLTPDFLYQMLHSYDTMKVFYGMGNGLRQSMKFEDFRRLPLLIPALSEQLTITNFLNYKTKKIDTLIQKQLQQIDLLKERRTALIAAAVTGKIDLRDWTPPASGTEASLIAEETTA